MIDELYRSVPEELHNESGRVFYSGRDAFSNPSRLYLLGLNPGGSPVKQVRDTVSSHSNHVLLEERHNWSAYRDESWQGASAGTLPLQKRARHLLRRLDLDPGCVPSSNLIFVRSAREVDLKGRSRALAMACWTFHERAIQTLNIEVVVCFGNTTGNWVRTKLGANELVESFVENNARGWKSQAFRNVNGIGVVIATHPSIADWTNPATDPSHLVANLLSASA
mgnify:CR=1 FL=1